MITMSAPQHVDVAAYVLGILDEPDDAAFSQHFAQCRRCRTEFRELSDLPNLLDQLKSGPPQRQRSKPPAMPSKQLLGRVLDEVNGVQRGRRTKLLLSAAAAVVLLITAPVVVWQLSSGNESPVAGPTQEPGTSQVEPTTTTGTVPTDVAAARTVGATNPVTGVSASISLEPEPWGTKLGLELRGVKGPMQCQLIAVSKTGESQVAATWTVPASGFGVPDSPDPLRTIGGAGMDLGNILRFDIRQINGPDLLVVVA
jgi:hypothetical protein